MDKPKRKVVRKIIILIAAVAVMLLCVALYPLWNNIFIFTNVASIYTECGEYPLSVYFFDVGSANAILISCEDTYILLDSGREKAQAGTTELLESVGVSKLDLLVLTHPDKDHIGDMTNILTSYEVERFITCANGDYSLTSTYTALIETAESVGVTAEYVSAGENLAFGELTLDVASPTKVYDTSNDNSVAMRVTYKDFSLFLAGDMSETAEKDVLETGVLLDCDVLCAAHHGSGSSTTQEFLSAVDPKTVIISVSESDSLPNSGTLQRLINYGCDIYRTDEYGTVAVVSDGTGYSVITEK